MVRNAKDKVSVFSRLCMALWSNNENGHFAANAWGLGALAQLAKHGEINLWVVKYFQQNSPWKNSKKEVFANPDLFTAPNLHKQSMIFLFKVTKVSVSCISGHFSADAFLVPEKPLE